MHVHLPDFISGYAAGLLTAGAFLSFNSLVRARRARRSASVRQHSAELDHRQDYVLPGAFRPAIARRPEDPGSEWPFPSPHVPEANADNRIEDLERLLIHDLEGENLRTVLKSLVDRGDPEAATLNSWLTWLYERPSVLTALPESERVDKFCTWRVKLDYYLYTPPTQLDSLELLAGLRPSDRQRVIKSLEQQQLAVQSQIGRLGISRMETPPGSDFVCGVIEISRKEALPTHKPEEDGKVARIEPGEGGYKLGTRILAPTLARPYCLDRSGGR